tara:strand:+ start:8203 stop:8928 length:726 start_codon:yes stop_codon:yes gene_type:complete
MSLSHMLNIINGAQVTPATGGTGGGEYPAETGVVRQSPSVSDYAVASAYGTGNYTVTAYPRVKLNLISVSGGVAINIEDFGSANGSSGGSASTTNLLYTINPSSTTNIDGVTTPTTVMTNNGGAVTHVKFVVTYSDYFYGPTGQQNSSQSINKYAYGGSNDTTGTSLGAETWNSCPFVAVNTSQGLQLNMEAQVGLPANVSDESRMIADWTIECWVKGSSFTDTKLATYLVRLVGVCESDY